MRDFWCIKGFMHFSRTLPAKTKILFMYALKDDFGKNIDIRSEKNQKQENKQLTNHWESSHRWNQADSK